MHAPEMLLSLILMVSLTFYVLLGGADYGGGVWDLLASGPRSEEQRELISHAITPVWEANHVWLILVIVLLFAGFPAAFAAMTTALNISLTVLIVGIVMRGSSFIFRAYHTGDERTQRRWGLIFAIASTVTPICLGNGGRSNLFGTRDGKRRCLGERLSGSMARAVSLDGRPLCALTVCISRRRLPDGRSAET
jgi:cytochrome d ubiquinol oxidase subunit II